MTRIIDKKSALTPATKVELHAEEVDAIAFTTETMKSVGFCAVAHRGRLEGTCERYNVCAPRGSLSLTDSKDATMASNSNAIKVYTNPVSDQQSIPVR